MFRISLIIITAYFFAFNRRCIILFSVKYVFEEINISRTVCSLRAVKNFSMTVTFIYDLAKLILQIPHDFLKSV